MPTLTPTLTAFFLVLLAIVTGCSTEEDLVPSNPTILPTAVSPQETLPTNPIVSRPSHPAPKDVGDTLADAASITIGNVVEATLKDEDDVDVFRFELAQSGFLTVRTEGDTDTRGTLLDSNGKRIDQEFDRSLSDLNFQIDEFLEAGTYFVEVTRDFLASPGMYTLITAFSPVVEATFELECQSVKCPLASEVSTFTSQTLEIVTCQWQCADFEDAADAFVILTFQREFDGCFEPPTKFKSDGVCFAQ